MAQTNLGGLERSCRIAAAVVLVAVFASHAVAQQADLDRLRRELYDAEIAVEKMRYRVPPCGSASDLAEYATRYAKSAGVASFAMKPLEGSEPVAGTPVRLQRMNISGRGEFLHVHELLHRLAMESEFRRVDIETLEVKALDGGTVRFGARIAEACWLPDERPVVFPGNEAEMYRRRTGELKAAASAFTQLGERMRPLRFVDWLAALDEQWGEHSVLLSELHYAAPQLTVKGIASGSPAKRAIERTAEVKWSPAGLCRAFTATGRVPARDFDEHHLAGTELFDERTSTLCSSSAPAPVKIAIPHGSGNLTLHARDIDIVGVFRVLHDLSPSDGYVVAPGVAGRIDADINDATIAEVLDAMRAAGVAYISPGPLHRVCKSDCGASKQTYQGELLSIQVNEAEAGDLLHVLSDVTQREILVPRDLQGRVAFFARDMPWEQLLEAMMAVVGQTYTIDATRIQIGADRTAAIPIGALRTPLSRRTLVELDAKKIGVEDVRLAVLARAGGDWKAWARALGPSGLLIALDPGTALFDGRVVSVGAGRVTLRTDGGRDRSTALRR